MIMMNSNEVCEKLGISPATLNRRVRDGELKPANARTPGQKRVPKWLFKEADVDALAERTMAEAGA